MDIHTAKNGRLDGMIRLTTACIYTNVSGDNDSSAVVVEYITNMLPALQRKERYQSCRRMQQTGNNKEDDHLIVLVLWRSISCLYFYSEKQKCHYRDKALA